MNYSALILFLLSSLMLISGCDEPVSGNITSGSTFFQSEYSPYVLNGTVLDENGLPVSGAEIHFMLKLWNSPALLKRTPNKTTPSTYISFGNPISGAVSLRIYRLGTREYITTLLDTNLSSGQFSVYFNSGAYTNGYYIYQLAMNGTVHEKLMLNHNTDLSILLKSEPLTRSDAEGKFRLPVSVFGLEERMIVTNETSPNAVGIVTVDSIAIVVHQSGKLPLVQWMSVTNKSNMEQTYILK